MIRPFRFAVLGFLLLFPASVNAQGLLWYLPEDNTGVEYQGEITTETIRDDLPEGMEIIRKERQMTIKSVGQEDAEYNGTVQPCRWIEIKVITGEAGAAGIDPGPVGQRIYKVLVPESKIIDQPKDKSNVENIMIPIVKGFRRNGESAVQPIKTKGLAFYPTICQLVPFPDLEVVASSETPQMKATNISVNARHVKGATSSERPESRTEAEADMWVSSEVPFGLARWESVVTQKKKESTAPRSAFVVTQKTKSEMSVSRILTSAESELVVQ